MHEYNSTINNVFSVQPRLACREFVIELLNCVFQLFSFSDQRLLVLLFQDHKTFHVEEKKRTQQIPVLYRIEAHYLNLRMHIYMKELTLQLLQKNQNHFDMLVKLLHNDISSRPKRIFE